MKWWIGINLKPTLPVLDWVDCYGAKHAEISSKRTTPHTSNIRLNENQNSMKDSPDRNSMLSHSARLKKVGMGVVYLICALTFFIYSIILTTNILTQLNPANSLFYYGTALICYGLIVVGLVLLWHRLSQSLSQAYSGLEN